MLRAMAVLGMAVLMGAVGSAAAVAPTPRHPVANLCLANERPVYSCRFGAKLGSVCVGQKSVHYRFGAQDHAEVDVASDPAWSNIHQGGNRSQGGLNQDYIRFTNGLTHYIVHSDETGSLAERPGQQSSGIAVLEGTPGWKSLASLECKARSRFNLEAFGAIHDSAPDGWNGSETRDGPFDVVY